MQADRDARDEMTKAFLLFDHENTGKITLQNLVRVAKEVGEDFTDDELRAMLQEADKNGDNAIDLDEFLSVMQRSSQF